ncbi:MAG: hypothetical protein ACP5OG_04175 [Candidatus Nanoarchaeia archaeon]
MTQTQDSQEQEHAIILGDLDIGKYLIKQEIPLTAKKWLDKEQASRIKKLEERIEQIQGTINSVSADYTCEREYLKSLKGEREQLANMINSNLANKTISNYPQIDMSFLGIRNFWDYDYPTLSKDLKNYEHTIIKIPLPKFVPYSESNGFSEFKINCKPDLWTFNFNSNSNNNMGRQYIDLQISKGLRPLSNNEWDILNKGLRRFTFTSKFLGIIPESTKKRMQEAKKAFSDLNMFNELYIIAETPINQWIVSELIVEEPKLKLKPVELPQHNLWPTRDPLLVAVTHENRIPELYNLKCYLIDHFNTTLAEDYVRKEFTRGKLEDK